MSYTADIHVLVALVTEPLKLLEAKVRLLVYVKLAGVVEKSGVRQSLN